MDEVTEPKSAAGASAVNLIESGLNPKPAGQPQTETKPQENAGKKDEVTPAPSLANVKPPEGFVASADLDRIVQERVDKAMKESAINYSNQRAADSVRDQYIREKMMDLPLTLRNAMPKSGDMAQLQKFEQEIRTDFRQWYDSQVKAGKLPKMPDVIGIPLGGSGVSPMQITNQAPRTSVDLITAGLRKIGIGGKAAER